MKVRFTGLIMCVVWGFFCGRLFAYDIAPVLAIVGSLAISSVALFVARISEEP